MAQLTGIVYIKIDSLLLQTLPGATLDLGGLERSARNGYSHYGHADSFKESTVTCEVVHGAATDLVALGDTDSATLTFECDSGPIYTIARAFLTMPPVLTGGADSKVDLEFKGEAAIQAA